MEQPAIAAGATILHESPKHGGDAQRVELDESDLATTLPDERLLAIDEALDQLVEEEPQAAASFR